MEKVQSLEKLNELFGYNPASDPRWFPEGTEFLRFIGIEMIKVVFTKDESGEWSNKYGPILIESVEEGKELSTEELGMNYWLTFSEAGSNIHEKINITPDGFITAPREDGSLVRIVPCSLHFSLQEADLFNQRLPELYEETTTPVEVLKKISESEHSDAIFNYSSQFIALIKVQAAIEGASPRYMWFRVSKIEFTNTAGVDIMEISDINGNGFKIYDTAVKEYTVEMDNNETALMKIIKL